MSSMELETERGDRSKRARNVALYWPFVRTATGGWEYEWGGRVPGATDLLLQDRYGYSRVETDRGAFVVVPAADIESDQTLTWCGAYWDFRAQSDEVLVPLSAWEHHDQVVGVLAPELMAAELVDTDGVAKMAGMSSRTISNYLSRGSMPGPVAYVGHSPVWTRPTIQHWLATRMTVNQPKRGSRASLRVVSPPRVSSDELWNAAWDDDLDYLDLEDAQ